MGGETRLNHWRAEVKLLSFFSLKCLSVHSPHVLCQKLSILFHILTANAKVTWVELRICGMDEKLKVCYREQKHMEVKRKAQLIFYFFRKMVIKTIKRAKLKPFNSTSCRSERCSPTLRSCLTHPLPSCPLCKSCQESLMCFKSKSHTCSQVNNCFNTTPNLTRGKGQQNHIWDFSSLWT